MSTSLTRSFVKFALLPFALSIGLSACGAGTEDAREIPQTGLVIRDLVIRDQQAQPDVVIRGVVATGEQQGLVIRDRTDGLGQEVVLQGLVIRD
ncbi:MAG TPA: hypothetical protein VF794_32795 [Archangium sp.]|jgi:hypothetical protein|uniref:hypothetical protein n=1 Tax=Archangium sp. TaxID=1872627 RepID=UPI002ED807F7